MINQSIALRVGQPPALQGGTSTVAFDPVQTVLKAARIAGALQQADDSPLDRASRLARAFRLGDDSLAFPKTVPQE
jgi:hypothetical protein